MNHQSFSSPASGAAKSLSDPVVKIETKIPTKSIWSVPAEVRQIDGKWKAVRIDGKPRWEDGLIPSPPDEIGTKKA